MKKLINNSTLFELTSKLTFGRYKGKILRNIIKKDPDYIAWRSNYNTKKHSIC